MGRRVSASDRPLRILVVDDERMLADLLTDLLEAEGYAVQCVYGPHEALAVLRSGELPDLVLSDVMMPGMSGIQLVDAARQRLGLTSLPFLLLSASVRPRLRWPNVGFMAKPLDLDALLAQVAALAPARPTRGRTTPAA